MFVRYLKNQQPSQRTARLWLLAWIFAAQFPLPVVHSHEMTAPATRSMAEHIAVHHADDLETEGLHWHLIMPWELLESQRDVSCQPSSPLGGWTDWGSASAVLPENSAPPTRPVQLSWIRRPLASLTDVWRGFSSQGTVHNSPLLAMCLLGHPMCALSGVALI